MLVLSRKMGESIFIGQNIQLTVSSISGSRVKICIDAPRECSVRREEIVFEQTPRAQMISFPKNAVAR